MSLSLMADWQVIFCVCFGFFAICLYFLLWCLSKGREDVLPPSLKPENAIDGNMNEIKACGSLHSFLQKYHKKFGSIFSYWHGPTKCTSIASPKLFAAQSMLFDRPFEIFKILAPLISEDSFEFTNGDEGRKKHAMYSKCFNPSAVKNYFDTFNKYGKDTLEKFMSFPKGEFILLQKNMFEYAIKSILESIFGQEFENDNAVKNLKNNYDICWQEIENGFIGDFAKPGSIRAKEFEIRKEALWASVRAAIEHRKEIRLEPGGEMENQLPVDVILNFDLTQSQMVADLLTIFVAGFHTTAYLLTWTIYFLATHQDIQDKVRDEIRTVFGEKYEVTPDNVAKLKYMQQILNETLRLSAIATFACRVHHSDMILGGFLIPAKMPVIHALSVVLHDEHVYPEPLKFDPERFTAENENVRPPFSFEPFGFAGKRKCPGYNFAYAESNVLLCYLIRSFKIELAPDQVVEPYYGFLTYPKNDVWIIASPL